MTPEETIRILEDALSACNELILIERTAHAETRRERDLLAKACDSGTVTISFPNGRSERIYRAPGDHWWRRVGIEGEYITALRAIRAALNHEQQETTDA